MNKGSPDLGWRQLAAAILWQAVRDAERLRGGEALEARSFLVSPMAAQMAVELGVEPGGLARFGGEPVPEQLVLDGIG